MELLLFPSMTILTWLKSFASFFIACNECTTLPVFAEICIISEYIWFPSIILKVMCVHTLCFVVFVIVRAPFCLKVEDVEIKVLVLRENMMDEPHFDVFNWVCKRAIVTILTLLYFIRKEMTKLGFVFVFMIKSFHSVVRTSAFIFLWTFFCISKFAKFRSI